MILFGFPFESVIQELGVNSFRDRKLHKSPFHLLYSLYISMLIFRDISPVCYSLHPVSPRRKNAVSSQLLLLVEIKTSAAA